ncbi:MAG: GNAT family N-acetyltransferase [Merdibacter sp.]
MIRFGCAKGAAAVYRLICALEDAAFPRARFDQLYLAQCADERIFSLVWEEDGEVIGFANVRMEDQLASLRAHRRDHGACGGGGLRGRGIGTVLFDRACALSAQAGCVQIELSCSCARHDAHRFYARKGMCLSHRRYIKTPK